MREEIFLRNDASFDVIFWHKVPFIASTVMENFPELAVVDIDIIIKIESTMLSYAFRNALTQDELGREILHISLPTALALAADPVASLIDTAFIGQIGLICIFHMQKFYLKVLF